MNLAQVRAHIGPAGYLLAQNIPEDLRRDLIANRFEIQQDPFLPMKANAYLRGRKALRDTTFDECMENCNSQDRCHSPVCPICQRKSALDLNQTLIEKFARTPRGKLFFTTIIIGATTDPERIPELVRENKRMMKDLFRGLRDIR